MLLALENGISLHRLIPQLEVCLVKLIALIARPRVPMALARYTPVMTQIPDSCHRLRGNVYHSAGQGDRP